MLKRKCCDTVFNKNLLYNDKITHLVILGNSKHEIPTIINHNYPDLKALFTIFLKNLA